ncbi:MAG: prephenate dehydrogenase/arogenate dehydrogenase family protein [Candidatus Omnitrophica bacterium]|nr:prephenate dehydrogenase/arogenate dehydrogenase family protein [Candidatus Omnitrophota bacterium]
MSKSNQEKPLFDTVAILGLGLMGGSLGMALKQRGVTRCVSGFARKESVRKAALKLEAVDQVFSDPQPAVAGAELVVLCTPLSTMAGLVERIAGALQSQAVVTDVGSTKLEILTELQKLLHKGTHVVGSHPMCGSHLTGIMAASPDLYEGAPCFVTPTARTHGASQRRVEKLWRSIGCKVKLLSPGEHDRLVAAISHVPHLAAVALVNAATDEQLAFAGSGFMDSTRIAAGSPELWRDICVTNRKEIGRGLKALIAELQKVERQVRSGRDQTLTATLERASERRQRL